MVDARDPAVSITEFVSAILDALPAHIAVIDAQGTIITVNSAWRAFGTANGMRDSSYGVGVNYFKICRAAVDPIARAAEQGIREVVKGTRQNFDLEYACHSPDEKRWFVLRASALQGFAGFAVLAHENITGRVIQASRLQARISELENSTDALNDEPKTSPVFHRTRQNNSAAPVLLLVDDDAALLTALSRFLSLKGAQVRAFTDPSEALDGLQAGIPDFILCDYHMPNMTGDEFIRRARQRLGREIPSMLMSGKSSSQVVQGAKSVGCELLTKPFDTEIAYREILDAL